MKNFISLPPSAAAAALALGLTLLPAADSRAAGPFTVNSTADTHAASPGTSANDSGGHISLRSAIEAANAQTGATTINVPAATYTLTAGELQVSTNGGKTISILGAGAAATVVSQGDNVNRVFNIDLNSGGGSTATISGLTIEGGTDKSDNFGGAGILDGSLDSLPRDVLNLQNCVIQNNHCQALTVSANGGGGVQMAGGDLNITSCTFSNNSSGSSPGGGVLFFPQNDASSLSVTNSLFIRNSIADVTGAGIGGAAIYLGSSAASSTHTITGCTFMSNAISGSVSGGKTYGAVQVLESGANNFLNISASSFISNSAASASHTTGLGAALAVNSGKVTVSFCRFFGNTADAGTALFSSVANLASVTAQNNWWGCNGGPGASGCGSITGDGTAGSFGSTVNFTPWIVLSETPNPATISVNGTSTLTASFLQNSAGTALSAANVAVLDGVPVAFNNAVLGSISGATAAIEPAGTALATFTAGASPGMGKASVTVDDATVTASITIGQPPLLITLNPTDTTVCSGSTATFIAAASGSPTPTVFWQVSANGGLTFTSLGVTNTTLSFTATTAQNSNEYRAVFTNTSGSTNSGPATLTVNPPPVAGADKLGTTEGKAANAPVVKLLANDSSPNGGALSITGVTTPSAAGGAVVLNGAVITYTPAAGFFGSDSFTYTLNDTHCTAQGTVNVTVTATNAPTANTISVTLTGTGRVVLFAGVPGVTYVVQWSADPATSAWTDFADGTIAASGTGLIQYTDSTSPLPPARFYRTRVGP